MGESFIPRVQPLPVLDLIWPQVNAPIDTATPGAFSANGYNRLGGAAVSVWGGTSGAAGTMALVRDQVGGSIPAGHRNADGLRFYMPLTKALFTATRYKNQEWQRVYRASVNFSFTSANPTTATGICIEMGNANGALPTYPSAAGNGAGFGVQGNGGGGLQTFSKPTIAGGFTNQVAIALAGVPITEILQFDFELKGATAQADGNARIFLNGVLIFNQSWGAGSILPDYNLATQMNHMRIAVNSGAGETVFLGPSHILASRFTLETVEQFNSAGGSI